tara:strand:+ start:9122 stop:10093 length:972 start_codon:yes stop_codon:yes gene_type:complete
MKPKEILVFGASGQIGRNLIRKLTKNNYKVVAVTRNIHQKGLILKTQANPGYLEVIELDKLNEQKIRELFKTCSICINLIGILYEEKENQFKKIHTIFPKLLSKIAKEKNIDQFIHVSALGVENATDSKYAISKLEGEIEIRKNFEKSVILKPSLVYSIDDNFTTNFMTLLSRLPVMPLFYNGQTKFAPIHVSDLTDIIFELILNGIINETIECVGPEEITFKEILKKLLKAIDKKCLLIPVPLPIAKIEAVFFEFLPSFLQGGRKQLTSDQLKLLKYDNISSDKYKTNIELKYNKKLKYFDNEILKYSYMWKTGGEFSKLRK